MNEEPELSAKAMAQAIASISEGVQSLIKAGLNERAILLLLSDSSGVGKRDIKLVLNSMSELGNTYLAPKKKA